MLYLCPSDLLPGESKRSVSRNSAYW